MELKEATMLMHFKDIAIAAHFVPSPDGKFDLPATSETAEALAAAAVSLLPPWTPGQPAVDVTLTGPGPVWGYLAIAHGLHGTARSLAYAAPNAPDPICVYSHGGKP